MHRTSRGSMDSGNVDSAEFPMMHCIKPRLHIRRWTSLAGQTGEKWIWLKRVYDMKCKLPSFHLNLYNSWAWSTVYIHVVGSLFNEGCFRLGAVYSITIVWNNSIRLHTLSILKWSISMAWGTWTFWYRPLDCTCKCVNASEQWTTFFQILSSKGNRKNGWSRNWYKTTSMVLLVLQIPQNGSAMKFSSNVSTILLR